MEAEAPLSRVTTFQLGGPCRFLIDCHASALVPPALRLLANTGQPVVLLGSGSNLLVSDAGFDGVVLRYVAREPEIEVEDTRVTVEGGASLDGLASATAEAGLDGLICCSGIPGTVGGAVAGNAGAWGKQIGDRLVDVTVADRQGRPQVLPATTLEFGYRASRLQREDWVVLEARFDLVPASAEALAKERTDILSLRARKHPNLEVHPCLGSFFRNLEPTSAAGPRRAAGWFLEQAGAKTLQVGGARVFPGHANIIVKEPGCTAQDVRDLAARMADAVESRFGFRLVREARYLGPFRGEPADESDGFH